jgi:diguanylate cyclase (GGDEF)-like protein
VAVSYAQTLSTDMIVAEIEALLDWRVDIMRQCFFPGSQARPADYHAPAALVMWCKKEAERNTIDRKISEKLSMVHDELCHIAQKFLEACEGGVAPQLAMYDDFENQFEGFVMQLRRLQQDVTDAVAAVDPVTGLRTVAGMRTDIKREQDRFDRKGTSFSIANVQIDGMDDLQQKYDRRSMDAVYANMAQVIARTVRSFDDAYYLGKGEYLIVLKHVEFMDACSVMDRLRGEIENTPIFMPSGDKLRITASFGIAEALQRESPDHAIDHAKQALNIARGEGGNKVKEYHERSALEQYARDVHKR